MLSIPVNSRYCPPKRLREFDAFDPGPEGTEVSDAETGIATGKLINSWALGHAKNFVELTFRKFRFLTPKRSVCAGIQLETFAKQFQARRLILGRIFAVNRDL